MSAFDRLSGALQYQIVNNLGFRELRPVQEQSIAPILDGKNCVVLAPTAGGKTEAAFFPLLSAMDAEDWRPVSVLYLSPIRALLNDLEPRIARYAGTVGRRAFKWHGDTAQSERRRFIADPTDFLLITPESLEAMLMSSRVPAAGLLRGLRAVVIDEVHAFADDDRGAHLSALLERVSRLCGRDVQRIGLSATVGNPEEILTWQAGSSKRPGVVVAPGGERKPPQLALDYVGSLENAAHVIRALHPGRKRLVFVDSRGTAEALGRLLLGEGLLAFVTHGSLAASERRAAERAFHEGTDCVIVATSALELGIDVGDLDHVLQIDSPPTVASFLQRMGRTGRRAGTVPNCTFLVTKEERLLQAAAIVRLFRDGYVEPVRPSRRATHILAHQVMALGIQCAGVPRSDWWAWLQGASAFHELTEDTRQSIVDHMLAQTILADHGGKLWLGPEGEKRYGKASFRELYAVFDAPRLITVRRDNEEVGAVDATFLGAIDSGPEPGTFVLAGRPWQIVTIEWERGLCIVRPCPAGKIPRWGGGGTGLSYALCQAMRSILVDTADDECWSTRARTTLATMRAENAFLAGDSLPVVETPEEIRWWSFAGAAANLLLARMLEKELGGRCIARNTSISLREDAAKSLSAFRELLARWRQDDRPTAADAMLHAQSGARSRVSKFQPCLPDRALNELLADTLLDLEGARAAIRLEMPR